MKKIILFFIILHFPLVIYGKNYLCIGEINTGLKKQQNGEWKRVFFNESKSWEWKIGQYQNWDLDHSNYLYGSIFL